MKSIVKLPPIIFLFIIINLSACSNSKVTKLSGVETYVATVKFGCIPDISGTNPIQNFVMLFGGGFVKEEFKKHFLQNKQGVVYAIAHPDHHFVVTSTDKGSSCSVLVRRINTKLVQEQMENMLFDLGFSVTEPTHYDDLVSSTGYTKGDIGIIVSFSQNKNENRNLDSITTVFKKKLGHTYDHNNSL